MENSQIYPKSMQKIWLKIKTVPKTLLSLGWNTLSDWNMLTDVAPVLSKDCLDIQSTTDHRFTLKRVSDMIKTHCQSNILLTEVVYMMIDTYNYFVIPMRYFAMPMNCPNYLSPFYLFISYSIAICGCLKCLFSSSGWFGFCQTFDLKKV